MAERKQYLDVLRALSTIGVIVIHVCSSGWYGNVCSFNWIVSTVLECVSRISVPIFFMISGNLLLNSSKEYNYPVMLKKIFRLVVFLLTWSIVYNVFSFFEQKNYSISEFVKCFTSILSGNTPHHLWYIYALIGLYMFVPILRILCNNIDRKTFVILLVLLVILGGGFQFFSYFQQLDFISININKINKGFSVGYFGYFLLGAYLGKYEVKYKRAIYVCGIVATLTTIGLVIVDNMFLQAPSERFWVYTMPAIYLSSIAFFVFIKDLCSKQRFHFKIIELVSKESLGIYGCHVLIIQILSYIGIDINMCLYLISIPLLVLIVLCISTLVSYLLKKIPYIGKMIS